MKSKLLLPGCFCKAGWGGVLCRIVTAFFVAFSVYMLWPIMASGTTDTKQNLWGHGSEVCASSVGQKRLLVCDGSPTSPWGIASVVHWVAGTKSRSGYRRAGPRWAPPLIIWTCQSRVSRPLRAHWLSLSQILYSVEQKVHDVFKSTKNLQSAAWDLCSEKQTVFKSIKPETF